MRGGLRLGLEKQIAGTGARERILMGCVCVCACVCACETGRERERERERGGGERESLGSTPMESFTFQTSNAYKANQAIFAAQTKAVEKRGRENEKEKERQKVSSLCLSLSLYVYI